MENRLSDGAIAANSSNPFSGRPNEGMTASMLGWFGLLHHWDFIYSDTVQGKPDWLTNDRHPLNTHTLYNRWKRADQLIGVRFQTKRGGNVAYLMLDVDRRSRYHPYQHEPEFRRLLAALEAVGLCRHILVRSSSSEGLHIYYPLAERVGCRLLANTIQRTLQQAEFFIEQGQLEIFPNVRSSSKVLYNGHRLPLQTGSYVLDDSYQPVHNALERLIETWKDAATSQDFDVFKKAIALNQIKRQSKSATAEEWRTRLETTLAEGWTAKGQTNDILKDLCIYARVFQGCSWDEVEAWVLKTAPNLPGYQTFCGHQRNIKRRIRDWVKANRKNKKYFPIGSKKGKKVKKGLTNEEKAVGSVQRIQAAIATIQDEQGALPSGVKNRMQLISERAGCSPNTLYKHKELWHPDFDVKGCVTPDSERIPIALETTKNETRISQAETQNMAGCVTLYPAYIPAISTDSLKHLDSTETPSHQAVTDPLLLSVDSSKGSDEESLESQSSIQIKVGDIVRWKADGGQFEIRRINSDGTISAKRLGHFVSVVNAYLKVSELELVKSQDDVA